MNNRELLSELDSLYKTCIEWKRYKTAKSAVINMIKITTQDIMEKHCGAEKKPIDRMFTQKRHNLTPVKAVQFIRLGIKTTKEELYHE